MFILSFTDQYSNYIDSLILNTLGYASFSSFSQFCSADKGKHHVQCTDFTLPAV